MKMGQAIDLGDWGRIDFSPSNKLKETMAENVQTAATNLGLDWLFPNKALFPEAAAPGTTTTKTGLPRIDPKILIIGGAGIAALLLYLAFRK